MPEAKRPPIWTKSRERRAAKRYLFGNFTARQLIPNEHYLNRVGLRGRKAWLCLCLFVAVYLIALAHLALTCAILGVLRFGAGGPAYFLFRSDGSLVWLEGGNLTDVRLAAPSNVSSYTQRPLSITGQSHNTINLQSSAEATPPYMSINCSTIQFSPKDSLHVLSSSAAADPLLSVNSTHLQLPELPSLSANLVTTKLTTDTVRNINDIESSRQLLMRGAAGVNVMGNVVNIIAGGRAMLRAETEIELEGGSGVTIDPNRIPKVTNSTGLVLPYHLCSCVNRRLFLVHANPRGCFAAVDQVGDICN